MWRKKLVLDASGRDFVNPNGQFIDRIVERLNATDAGLERESRERRGRTNSLSCRFGRHQAARDG